MSDDTRVAEGHEKPVATDAPSGWRRALGRGGRQASALRRWSVATLVAIACIGIIGATVSTWTHTVIFNTDEFVSTVAEPVGSDPEVTQRVAETVTAKAMEAGDVQNRITEALPPEAAFLAQPLTEQVQSFLTTKVNELLQTEAAQEAWAKMIGVIHQQLVAVLRDESNVFLVQGDDITLNLLQLVGRALALVQEYLPDAIATRVTIPQIDPTAPYDEQVATLSAAIGRPLPTDFGTVTIAEGTQIQQAQTAVRTFDSLVIALWVISALLIVAALVFSPWRLRTLLELGLGILIATLIARVAIKQIETRALDAITQQSGSKVAESVVTTALTSLGSFTTWLLVSGVILSLGAFFGGRPHLVKAAGSGAVKLAGRGAAMANSQMPDAQRMAETHFDYLRGGGVVAAVIALFFATGSLTWVIITFVLLAAWELLVWWLARRPAVGGGKTA